MQVDIQKVTDHLSMVDYKIIKGKIETPEDFEPDDVTGYTVNDNLKLSFSPAKKWIKADYEIGVNTCCKSCPEASVFFHFVFIYSVDNFEELTSIKENTEIEVNPLLENSIAAISYSTTRGILLTRLQGTVMSDFILPITNTNTLLNKNTSE